MALSFDGSSYLSRDLGGTGPISSYSFSLAAWIKPPQEKKDWQDFVISDGTQTYRYGIGAGNYARWAIYWKGREDRTASDFSENYQTAEPNPWFHQVGIFAADASRLAYVNGSGNSWSNANNSPQTLTDPDIIGIGYGPTSGSNRYSKGEIAECALYNVALDAKDIDALAAGFSPLFVKPSALVGYWPLGGPLVSALSGADVFGRYDLSITGTLTETLHPPIFYPTPPHRTATDVTPDPVIPGQGHDYALPDNVLDYALPDRRTEYALPESTPDYGVQPDGT